MEAITVNPADPHAITSAESALQFILAGNAIFTLRSKSTGTRYTYKVSKADDSELWFVGLLIGSDNNADYTYLGIIRNGLFSLTSKSKMNRNSAPVLAIQWTLGNLKSGTIPQSLEIWHEGRCGRCGRTLTVPESIERGLGPECAAKMSL